MTKDQARENVCVCVCACVRERERERVEVRKIRDYSAKVRGFEKSIGMIRMEPKIRRTDRTFSGRKASPGGLRYKLTGFLIMKYVIQLQQSRNCRFNVRSVEAFE